MSETIELRVTGMTCGGCENAVKRAVGRVEGVVDVTASHADDRVGVTFDPATVTLEVIKQTIAAAGYTVAESDGPRTPTAAVEFPGSARR